MLDIVGFFARIISLSLRLFGNMSAGSILLNVAYLGLSAVTISLISLNIPIGIPLIVYLQ
ncbi:F0F1 ATP synthase subunit A [Patescibacteria group bacterium]|nr:F0F1 ATP synthase subunit A [Patescibacteria group bacterium]MBP7841974.1 F0F1 ATP synthase subunit A [Patescibacteria group bacterium]